MARTIKSVVPRSDARQDPVGFLDGVGSALWSRFQDTQVRDDLDAALEAYERAVSLAVGAHPARWELLGKLAWLRAARFQLTGDASDLQGSSDASREALAAAPDTAARAEIFTSLGTTWWDLYRLSLDREMLQHAIGGYADALAIMPKDWPKRGSVLDAFAMCLRHRQETGDLDVAIDTYCEALALAPSPSQRVSLLLDGLGSGLVARYQSAGVRDDLDRAVAACREAVEFQPENWSYQSNLGAALLTRYHDGGDGDDLQGAIDVLTTAASLVSPASSDWVTPTKMLSQMLSQRYERHGDRADLEASIAACKEVVASIGADTPDAVELQLALGHGLASRYELTGAAADADGSSAAFHKAIAAAPASADPEVLRNLGGALRALYDRSGEFGYLNDAIGAFRQAIATTLVGGPLHRRVLNSLGIALLARFERSGELDDLDAAIAACEEAVELAPVGSPDRPGSLTNLGSAYATRYRSDTGPSTALVRARDLVSARAAYDEALAITPAGSPDRAIYLNNWANILIDEYSLFGEMRDLVSAIAAYETIVGLTAPASPLRAARVHNLGGALWLRFETTHERADLQAAIEAHDKALELTAETSQERPMYLRSLGQALGSRYSADRNRFDLIRGVDAFRQSSQGVDLDPASALTSADVWASWAVDRESWEEAEEAYRLGIRAAQLMLRRQLSRGHKESWLRRARRLAGHGAVAFARSGDLEQAVLALENGRALLLSEALERERSAQDALLIGAHSHLAERYLRAAERLNILDRA